MAPDNQFQFILWPYPADLWPAEPLPDEYDLLGYAKNGHRPQLLEHLAETSRAKSRSTTAVTVARNCSKPLEDRELALTWRTTTTDLLRFKRFFWLAAPPWVCAPGPPSYALAFL